MQILIWFDFSLTLCGSRKRCQQSKAAVSGNVNVLTLRALKGRTGEKKRHSGATCLSALRLNCSKACLVRVQPVISFLLQHCKQSLERAWRVKVSSALWLFEARYCWLSFCFHSSPQFSIRPQLGEERRHQEAEQALPESDSRKTGLQRTGAHEMCQPQECKSFLTVSPPLCMFLSSFLPLGMEHIELWHCMPSRVGVFPLVTGLHLGLNALGYFWAQTSLGVMWRTHIWEQWILNRNNRRHLAGAELPPRKTLENI